MKKIVTGLFLFFFLTSCSDKDCYTISGTVGNSDMNDKYVYLFEYGKKDIPVRDSSLVKNSSFTFTGTQDSPVLYTVSFSKDDLKTGRSSNKPFSTVFVLENGKIQLQLDSISTIKGTPENNSFHEIQARLRSLQREQQSKISQLPKESTEKTQEIYWEYNNKMNDAIKNYILQNSDKVSGGKLLVDYRYRLSEEDRNEIIDKADATFVAVPGVQGIAEHLAILKTVAIGNKFVDFQMDDIDGAPRKLSDFVGNGKVVLIDFWASWCPPCRAEMPELVEIHKEYKDKGFNIIGISLDSKKEDWLKGIKDLNITWPQLSDLKGWQNAGAALYGVNSIPHTVLVDADGTILAKYLNAESVRNILEAKLK